MKKIFMVLFMVLFHGLLYGEELPLYFSFTSDYSASMVIPKKRLEVGLEYANLSDRVDVFNAKKKELSNIGTSSLGDYGHIKLTLNYGFSLKSMLLSHLSYGSIEYGSGDMDIYSYSMAIRRSFESIFSIEGGIKGDVAKDVSISDIEGINYYLQKFNSNISMSADSNFIWFKTSGTVVGIPKKDEPKVNVTNMNNITGFIKFTLGKAFDYFYPNIFLEVGKTKINTKIDTNLKNMVPYQYRDRLPELPLDLSRDETYIKGGCSIFIKTPFNTLTSMEYSYIKLNRSTSLGYIDYNHILKANINYFLKKNIILSVGGQYMYRQFNGVIPFMYNKYSQTTFDHPYGWVSVGITYLCPN